MPRGAPPSYMGGGRAGRAARSLGVRLFDGITAAKTAVMAILWNGVWRPVSEWRTMGDHWDMDTVPK